MLFYKMTFTCDLAEEKHENPAADKRFRQEESFSRRREESYICRCNEKLYDALGSSSKFCFITGYGPGGDCVTAVFSVKEQEEVSYFSAALRETLRLPEEVGMEVQEITVLEACKYYVNKTGRRITFEYTVIHGTNDLDEDVNELVRICGMMQSHVNVIPVNSAGRGNFAATRKDAETFASKLNAKGVNATVRRTLGDDISAACGQLRRETQNL